MNKDILFLQKEKGLDEIKAKELLDKYDNDIVEAILSLEGGSNIKEKETVELSKEQQAIKELRNIVDKKDEIMDNIINKNK